ncbi:MAG: septal ring lytic transglycosylase RlpA family protein [Candidatus Binataceae bacterium]
MEIPAKPQSSLFPILIAMLTIGIVLMRAANSLAASDRTPRNSRKTQVHPGETLTGKATYYPSRLNGHKTSSGETFRQNENTAASNKLPIGTEVKVTNLKSGKSTDVRVTDRGTKLGNHKIDLSKKAANEIGLNRKEGTTPVKIKVMSITDDRKAP